MESASGETAVHASAAKTAATEPAATEPAPAAPTLRVGTGRQQATQHNPHEMSHYSALCSELNSKKCPRQPGSPVNSVEPPPSMIGVILE
jgi:hypothetical protein